MNNDNLEKLPKTEEKEIFILLDIGEYSAGRLSYLDYDSSKYGDDKILLGTQMVTFKIPQKVDIKGKAVESLEEKKVKINAKFHMELKVVQDKIDNLLAIEYKPT